MTKKLIGFFMGFVALAAGLLVPISASATEAQYVPDDQEQIPENPQPVYAEDFTLSDEQLGMISQNCPSIKNQLRRVQRTDAKSRVHLGAQFEVISTNLMLNLNLRLVKNNLATAELTEQQTTFSNERARFKDDYIEYSKSLEQLIDTDCQKQPTQFYEQLTKVREKRSEVQQDVYRLTEIVRQHRESVVTLKESLK